MLPQLGNATRRVNVEPIGIVVHSWPAFVMVKRTSRNPANPAQATTRPACLRDLRRSGARDLIASVGSATGRSGELISRL